MSKALQLRYSHFYLLRLVLVAIVPASVLLSCLPPAVDPEETVGEIRFVPGEVRTYAWRYRQLDPANRARLDTTDTFRVRVGSIDGAVSGMTGLIRLEAWSESNPSSGKTYVWYHQSPDSLEEVAYAWAGRVPVILLKRNSPPWGELLPRIPFVGPFTIPVTGKVLEDSIIVRNDSRLVLRYPARKGLQWISFVDPFLQTREIVGTEDVTTPAGRFLCLKILTRLPSVAPSLQWYDYVNRYGLVARTITDTILSLDGSGQPRDTLRTFEQLVLLSQ